MGQVSLVLELSSSNTQGGSSEISFEPVQAVNYTRLPTETLRDSTPKILGIEIPKSTGVLPIQP